jgi:hypothetical protein
VWPLAVDRSPVWTVDPAGGLERTMSAREAADHPWRGQIAQEVADQRAQQARVAVDHP